jgi:GNAT superfamily N-acetyltransferase
MDNRGMNVNAIALRIAAVDEVIASGLIAELDADLLSRYPGEPINGIDAEEFRAAGGLFVVAGIGEHLAGCGAFRPYDRDIVEIKRMFVKSAHRGHGIGRAILRRLEDEARQRGFRFAVLETGNRQPEAIALYEASGYRRIELFGPYIGSDRSVCFRKALSIGRSDIHA